MPAAQMPTTGSNAWFNWRFGTGVDSSNPYSQTGETALATTPTVTSTSATYAPSAWIDAQGMNQIAIAPTVTTAGGSNGYFKIQWSGDGINLHGEDNYDASGVVASGEYRASTVPFVMSFPSGSIGIKQSSLYVTSKKMRWFRVAQCSEAAATTVAATYSYQMS